MSHTTLMFRSPARSSLLLTTPVLALLLSACQPGTDAAAPPASAASALAATAASTAAAADAPLMQGVFFWGPQVETFSPCNTNQTFWLDGEPEQLAPLEDMAIDKADKANEAYQPIYAEIRAVSAGQATDGYAVEYDGVLSLQQVVTLSPEVPSSCKLIQPPPPPSGLAASAED